MRYEPIDSTLFISNRQRLAALLLPQSLVALNANDILPSNADGSAGMIPNSDLFYFSGIEQEQSILLLFPDADDERQREILFLRQPSPELECWEGHKLTQEEARRISGIRNVQWLSEFPRLFHRLMCECEHVYLNTNEHKRAVIEVETREARFVAETLRSFPLHRYHRLARLIHQLRPIKSETELALIRRAGAITEAAFLRVLRFVKPGVSETEIEAEFAHEFTRCRARFAYAPIIASGPNACALHYIDNAAVCRPGELILLDVAATYANYNADLTRTLPVSGRFTRRQRQVYQAVRRVLHDCTLGLVPGKRWKQWQREAEEMIARECVQLGLLTARDIKQQNPDSPAVKKYFMHGVGHPLGLDVHDVGFLTEPFQENWVMTVEPGIYIPAEGFGVRLENDVLITNQGPVNLTAGVPIEAGEIEDLMRANTPSKRKPRQR